MTSICIEWISVFMGSLKDDRKVMTILLRFNDQLNKNPRRVFLNPNNTEEKKTKKIFVCHIRTK